MVVRSDRPPHQRKPSTRRQPESREAPDDDSGAQIPTVNLTTAIVAVLGFESQEICPASQFVISVVDETKDDTLHAALAGVRGGICRSRRLTSGPLPAFWRPMRYFTNRSNVAAGQRPPYSPGAAREADAHGWLDRVAMMPVRSLLVEPSGYLGLLAYACYEVSGVLLHIR